TETDTATARSAPTPPCTARSAIPSTLRDRERPRRIRLSVGARRVSTMSKPALTDLLHAAVTAVGGVERPGQVAMAEAVAAAVDDGTHLLVQAGTGTGKSLGYLVPALAHGDRVVVATATLALQRQLVERDLPRTVEALKPL